MSEIKCPHCGKMFKIDESDYNDISRQIRDAEFHKALAEHEKLAIEKEKLSSEAKTVKLESEIERLKDSATAEKEKYEEKIRMIQEKAQFEAEQAKSKAEAKAKDDIFKLKQQVTSLENSLKAKESEYQLKEVNLIDAHKRELALKDEQVEYYRDFKAKQSTKAIGESLERYCNDEFDKIRATAFPRAYFEKDNKVSETGSKGDFIYRDYDENGEEIISIMFEMKNEADSTDPKARHTNESFLKELDKDRNEKKCEYAVLVSMLEADNELYNTGIVDKSHRYPKMYVIRPQFFIPVITMLRNAAMNSSQYKHELTIAKSQNIDVENFEKEMNQFKTKFSDHYGRASKRYSDALDEIQKTIDHLEKVKAALMGSQYSLDQASKKVDELTIKRLTRNSPSVRKAFEDAEALETVETVS